MGGALSSPSRTPHPTSVCNHLFASPTGPLHLPRKEHWSWQRHVRSRPDQLTLDLCDRGTLLDDNDNYKGAYSPRDTVIPNVHSIREELSRLSTQDVANNNNVNGNADCSPPIRRWRPATSPCPAVHVSHEMHRRTVLHSSTSDLLRALGRFVARRARLSSFDPAHLVMWMRAVDRSLLLQGWQDVAFINPANVVFVFLLMRDVDPSDDCLESAEGVHQWVLVCLYIAYSYMGNEISYPLKPFLVHHDRDSFWRRAVSIILSKSSDMLRLNSSSSFFTHVFTDLRQYASDI